MWGNKKSGSTSHLIKTGAEAQNRTEDADFQSAALPSELSPNLKIAKVLYHTVWVRATPSRNNLQR